MIGLWALIVFHVLSAAAMVWGIGKERTPITPGVAVIAMAVNAIAIVILYAALPA